MSDYKKTITNFKHHGVPYRTFINEEGAMIIRYNECDGNYTEDVFDGIGKLIKIVDVQDGSEYVWQDAI